MGSISDLVADQRAFFNTGVTMHLGFREERLRKLADAIAGYEHDIIDALKVDLGRCEFESYVAEIGSTTQELSHTLKNIRKWAASEKVKTPLHQWPASCKVNKEPYGNTLIISPWNYPFQLAAVPIITAVAAGNCAIVKPSEYAPETSKLLADIIKESFDPSHVAVVEGDAEVAKQLLEEKFDHIFFTGSPAVGKIVYQAAAKHLTPVTLELGGKSPVIVDKGVDIKKAADRILWGKFINAGQTCIAPDYVLVHNDVEGDLLLSLKDTLRKFYGVDPKASADYGRIINERHHKRLSGLLSSANEGGAKPVTGGVSDERELYIAPTILTRVNTDMDVMREEIFGPILPVVAYGSLDEAMSIIEHEDRREPLALYLFSENRSVQKLVERVKCGGICINDTMVHFSVPELPFGGIGRSGMGSYHGKAGFDAFTHKKAVMKRGNTDTIPRSPPYGGLSYKMIRKFFK